MVSFTVKDLIEHGSESLDLTLIAGASGLEREIGSRSVLIFSSESPNIWKHVEPGGMLLISGDELSLFATVPVEVRQKIADTLHALALSIIILSRVAHIPEFIIDFSDRELVPLATSGHDVFRLESRITGLIREKVDHAVTINGVFVQVFGIGVVITGESGIGKSECGLELVTRGHKLIADDIVEITKKGDAVLYGRSTDLTKYFMEIRGLGVINIKSLFGVAAVSDEASLRIMVEFIQWREGAEFDRIESKEQFNSIMEVNIPLIKVPVRSGGSMATIVEIVARNEILKTDNYSASRDLRDRIVNKIRNQERKKTEN